MEWAYMNNGSMLVKKIPGDGNCLFAALIHQENRHNIIIHKEEIIALREEIANHIRHNKPKYEPAIMHSIYETHHGYAHEHKEELIEKYLQNLTTDGFWGGEETIAAYAELKRKCIVILLEGGNSITFGQENEENGTLTLAYRYAKGSGSTRNHYDSVMDTALTARMNFNQQRQLARMAEEQTINGYELDMATPASKEKSQTQHSTEETIIASWNVRGCSNPKKRIEINNALNDEGIDIACLQETKMTAGTSTTEHYSWFHSGKHDQDRTSRGVAILVRNTTKVAFVGYRHHTENICEGIFKINETQFRIISVHIPSDKRLHMVYNDLTRAISRQIKENLIIMGDFNAHIGKHDIKGSERKHIGPKLYHYSSNENGRELINILHLFNLNIKSTWAKSSTVLTTWSNGKYSSQIDHILAKESEEYQMGKILAVWRKSVSTDHKILLARVKLNNKKEGLKKKNSRKEETLEWNVKRLKCEKDNQEYKEEVARRLSNTPAQCNRKTEIYNDYISNIIQNSATTTLNRPTSPLPMEVNEAINKHHKALREKGKDPNNKDARSELKKASEEKRRALAKHDEDKCNNFFKNIEDFHPAQRLQNSYKFLKKFRRTAGRKQHAFIPISHWERELQDCTGRVVEEVEETTHWPLNPPPSLEEIAEYCKELRSGRAPGTDRINIELIKEGPEELALQITEMMAVAWSTNEIPKVWTETVQVPIPKIRSPKETSDYRRITLCNTFYKIYAKHILKVLNSATEELPNYQAGFIRNRSTDDHMFTVRRILEEKWKGGQKIYVLSLDLSKAFDSVDNRIIPIILKHRGVPGWLTNRTIRACLTEETSILWYGQKTTPRKKVVGVKQGCPLSPKLFNLVLHEVLITVQEILPQFTLGLSSNMVPTILAYADDIMVITEKEEDLEALLNEITPILQSTGLKINLRKSHAMIRDPTNQPEEEIPTTLKFGRHEVQRARRIKYLGTYLTDTLDRPETVAERIKKAHQATRMLLPFITKHKLPWTIKKIIYRSIIVPIALYGLPVAVTTKANRTRLRHMERKIIALLHTDYTEKKRKTSNILEDKTILKTLLIRRIRYWGHIYRRENGHILKEAKDMHLTGPMKIGRPCFTWNTTIAQDLAKTGKSNPWWEQAANNKETLKAATKELYTQITYSDSEEAEESEESDQT